MNKVPSAALLLRLALIITWGVLFGLLLRRDIFVQSLHVREVAALEKSRTESFLGVYFHKKRIGYVQNRFLPIEGAGMQLQQEAYLLLNILGERQPVRMDIDAQLSNNFELRQFSMQMKSPFYFMQASGELQGNNLKLTIDTGKEQRQEMLRLKTIPFLSTNKRGYLLQRDLQVDEKIRVPYFDPITLAMQGTIIQYKGMDKEVIHGRVHNLHHFVESFSGVRIESWLNDEGDVVKEESPAGFVFIAEPEFRARDVEGADKELLSSVAVPVHNWKPEFMQRPAMRYRLDYPADVDFELNKDRQHLDGNILEVRRESLPPENAKVCQGEAENVWLRGTTYIQASHPAIEAKVKEIVTAKETPLQKVQKLSRWVFESLEKKPVVGLPDALSTLSSMIGDCNEHAALFAALARNAGVPTRVVAGVMLQQGAFYYHAWNEVCLDDRWVSLDTTHGQLPADISHIKFVEGESQEQVKIGSLIGKLSITPIVDSTEPENHAKKTENEQ